MVALILGPVSLIFGGAIASIAGLVCAIIALVKLRRIYSTNNQDKRIPASIKTQIYLALGICIVATVINVAYSIYMAATIYELINSKDITEILNSLGLDNILNTDNGSSSGGNTSGKSVWD